jgi:hypothetical protein
MRPRFLGRSTKIDMKPVTANLRPGDFVEVKPSGEILQTLDDSDILERLPFMLENGGFLGQEIPSL